jgi:fatty acid desaturase
MSTLDFIHGGPHDGFALPVTEPRSRVLARRTVATFLWVAVGLGLLALRYWIYLPSLHHSAMSSLG